MSPQKNAVPKLVVSKEQILSYYCNVFEGIGKFPGPPYHIQLDPSVIPKQTTCHPIPVHLKVGFKQEVDKMLQAGVLKPVHDATPWINKFVFLEGNDKSANLNLKIYLDQTNLNKAIVRVPIHFKTPEDIAHFLADACIMSVCDCKKRLLAPAAWWGFLISYNLQFLAWKFQVHSDVIWCDSGWLHFQCKWDQCFGHIKNVIVIEVAMSQLNYEKLQYKKNEVNCFGETYTTSSDKPAPTCK